MRRRRTLRRRALPASLAAAALSGALLGACGPIGADPQDPTTSTASASPSSGTLMPEGTTEVEVAVGQTVQVSLGMGAPGVGDDWGVISSSDAAVARTETVMGTKVFSDGQTGSDPEAPGSSVPYAVAVTGLQPGTTRVRVLYCTRTEIEEGCDQSHGTRKAPVAPVELTVTVH